MSPLHAAMIAASVANDGVMISPTLIDSVEGAPAPTGDVQRVLRHETADKLRELLLHTTTEGTAAYAFNDRRRGPVLGSIKVAGKTGSLSDHGRNFKDYSWFVGFAPADNPEIAFAVVVVNGLKWKVHAPYIAREAVRAYLVGGAIGQPPPVYARVKKWHRKRR
jgi:penicillin-binding protein A